MKKAAETCEAEAKKEIERLAGCTFYKLGVQPVLRTLINKFIEIGVKNGSTAAWSAGSSRSSASPHLLPTPLTCDFL